VGFLLDQEGLVLLLILLLLLLLLLLLEGDVHSHCLYDLRREPIETEGGCALLSRLVCFTAGMSVPRLRSRSKEGQGWV
jgi:hypothetical protein